MANKILDFKKPVIEQPEPPIAYTIAYCPNRPEVSLFICGEYIKSFPDWSELFADLEKETEMETAESVTVIEVVEEDLFW